MKSIEELEKIISTPSQRLLEDVQTIEGDVIILGVGGKMGPTLAKLLKNAFRENGSSQKVIGVSRFSNEDARQSLEKEGIDTISADLLNDSELMALPEVPNVIYMAGKKFGTAGNEHVTWTMNTYLPGRVATKFSNSSIVVFSSGNIYPFENISTGGSTEVTQPEPIGDYAQSTLGRERVFTHFAKENNTPMLMFRLNYAIDMRYGVLLEIAQQVFNGKAVNLLTGSANVIWQGDANEYAIRALNHCSTEPEILNVTGPETFSIRWLANEYGKRFGKEVLFEQEEQSTALINNAGKAHRRFGYPSVSLNQMIDWTAEWVQNDGEIMEKPTHFQERKGQF